MFAIFMVCRGIGLANLLDPTMHHGTMLCCDTDNGISFSMDVFDKFVAPVIIMGLILVLIVVSYFPFFQIQQNYLHQRFYWYYFSIRRRYGSCLLFEELSSFIRLGLLHPKTF